MGVTTSIEYIKGRVLSMVLELFKMMDEIESTSLDIKFSKSLLDLVDFESFERFMGIPISFFHSDSDECEIRITGNAGGWESTQRYTISKSHLLSFARTNVKYEPFGRCPQCGEKGIKRTLDAAGKLILICKNDHEYNKPKQPHQ